MQKEITLHVKRDESVIITQETIFQCLFGMSIDQFTQELRLDLPELKEGRIA